jgi:hypothetical protein
MIELEGEIQKRLFNCLEFRAGKLRMTIDPCPALGKLINAELAKAAESIKKSGEKGVPNKQPRFKASILIDLGVK